MGLIIYLGVPICNVAEGMDMMDIVSLYHFEKCNSFFIKLFFFPLVEVSFFVLYHIM